ncbi:hypothetical protein OZX65_02815 [Leuconostocaceae bacterium ESL0723]|nr:hypothetical protein OZX65_02815 [Leuconostocaceae bacterium ESL0723]
MTRKRTIFGVLLLLLLALIGIFFLLGSHSNSSENATETARQGFYKQYSGKQKQQVQDADRAVAHAANVRDEGKSTASAVKETNEKIDAISGEGQSVQQLRTTYHSIVDVVDNPTIGNLKSVRTNINGMHAGKQASYLDEAYSKPLVYTVAKATGKSLSTVEQESKPDSKQTNKDKDNNQSQSSQSSQSSSMTSQQNNQVQNGGSQGDVGQSTSNAGGTYTPPVQSGGDSYTAPAQSGGGTYTPPSNTPQISAKPSGDYVQVPGTNSNEGTTGRSYNNMSEIR